MEFIKVKRKRRTALDWYELVKQWLASGKSQREFCEANDIYPKTFSRWVCDYRNFFNDFTHRKRAFISLSIRPV